MTEEIYPPPLYTTAQAHFLAVVPYFTAPWSVIGSCLILRAILFDRKESFQRPRQRLMFCISMFDLLSSMGMLVLGPWVVPSDWPYGRSGRGSSATCQAAAFFLTLSYSTMWYTLFLAIYFVLHLRFEWKERRIAFCFEPIANLWSICLPLTSYIGSLQNGYIHPIRDLPGWCWFADDPPLCTQEEENIVIDTSKNETIAPCSGGKSALESIAYGNVLFSWVVIVICMLLIILKVRRLERNLQRYAIGGRGTSDPSSLSHGSSNGGSRGNEPTYFRTRETARQALLYIGVFLAIYSPLGVMLQLDSYPDDPERERRQKFTVALLVKIFMPMQGCFNAIVYFRRRFSSLVKDGKSLAFLRQIPWVGNCIDRRIRANRERKQRKRNRKRTNTNFNQNIVNTNLSSDAASPDLVDYRQSQTENDTTTKAEQGEIDTTNEAEQDAISPIILNDSHQNDSIEASEQDELRQE